MATKQITNSLYAPDGSMYATLTDGAGNLGEAGGAVIGAVTQSGTWTVQPGNTANTTAWKVDGSAVTQPVSGTVTANAGTGTLAVSLASVPSHAVTNAGTFAVQATPAGGPTTGTQSTVASSASSVTVLASNANRKGATVYNDSTQILYLSLSATTASTSSYSVQMGAGAFFEVPFFYTGQLTGIWASANGNVRITELT